MKHQEIREKLPLFAGHELPAPEHTEIAAHLQSCESCRRELDEIRKLDGLLSGLRLPEPPDELFESYWDGIYNNLERRFGWILLSLGAIVLVYMGLLALIRDVLANPGVAFVIKAAMVCLVGGIAVLAVSVVREQLFYRKRERYREVRK